MPRLPPTFRPHGARTKVDRDREADQRRGSSRERGYDSRWDKARRTYLLSHPLCVMCQADGRIEPATVVDHVTPHRGDQGLFWDQDNWQAICKPHHDGEKQSQERRDRL